MIEEMMMFEVYPPVAKAASTQRKEPTCDYTRCPVDLIDTGAGYEILADLPGFLKEEICISLAEGALKILAERKAAADGKRVFLHQERLKAECKVGRIVELPRDALMDSADAKYENGVLCISIPKELPKQRTIEIQ